MNNKRFLIRGLLISIGLFVFVVGGTIFVNWRLPSSADEWFLFRAAIWFIPVFGFIISYFFTIFED